MKVKAFEKEIAIEFTVSDQCLLCPKKFEWNEVIIIKAPEGACFCLDCAEKYPDEKKYDGDINCWICHQYMGKEVYEYSKDN